LTSRICVPDGDAVRYPDDVILSGSEGPFQTNIQEKTMEEQNTLVTLIDENGKEVEFDLVATFDYEKKRYAALIPIDEVENVDEDEVVILEVVKDAAGERYLPIENDILLDEVFNEFLEILDEMADGDEEE
jgi:uncharacterized protein YrzB (UPF0473 family)